jgi:N-methylhydantoinase B
MKTNATREARHRPEDFAWDGKDFPYRPASPLPVSPKLQFHHDTADSIDPITFEVISNRLWNINEEHADTIQRVSGSPIVVHAYDFNTCIQTEDGEPFLFAPYIQYFTGAAELIIKYTLENRSDNPEIRPGDIFISNDTLIAGSHQMDVSVYAPVFVDGLLFCWVFNSCHARDVGGVEPGGFCVQAVDHYSEAPSLRAVKLADTDGIRSDIEDTFLRFSRIPHLLALELRSQVAGVNRARTRIQELIGEYTAPLVKAAMRKLIDDTEVAVRRRLTRVPDGRWIEVVRFGGATPGDRAVHKVVINLRKVKDRLYFDNYGTDPQIGSINAGYGQFRAAIGAALAYTLAHDHRFCVGGVFRCTDIDAEIGTISAADRDGAISSTQAPLLLIHMAARVISRMLFPDPEQRPVVMGASSLASVGAITQSGIDQYGERFATTTLDHTGGGIGAFSFRDGIDQGGATFWPKSEMPDVETWEQFYPVLYLYRQVARNGGHGKFRGGQGVVYALCGHRTQTQLTSLISVVSSLSPFSGLYGGHWGDASTYFGITDGALPELRARGTMPSSPAELRAVRAQTSGELPVKTVAHPLGERDAIEQTVFGGGGYGDPLERPPAMVEADVRGGAVTLDTADRLYGVILNHEQVVDVASTAARRQAILANRLERATSPPRFAGQQTAGVRLALDVTERLAIGVNSEDGQFVYVCTRCDVVLCAADENYKEWSATIDSSLAEIDPTVFSDPSRDVDGDIVYRMFLCPHCGIALENELTLRSEPPVWDTKIDLSTISSAGDVDGFAESVTAGRASATRG